jgi:LacI family transcriptional regulator
MRCPDDVALVGFDDHPWAEVAEPPLTVVRQPARELGRVAANVLLALIKREPVTTPRTLLECELVVRQSVWPYGAPPA